MTKKRQRPIHLHVMISEEEQAQIQERMAEAGIRNMGAYLRKMALNGYVLQVDLAPVRELVSLQRRCSNNLNQVAIQANTYGGIYPNEITALQKDYADLWEPLSELLEKLSDVVKL
ncbi:MAG: plasmid mobilization relaxosome protein MobC [Oscillospiraceae bacterium]